MAQERRAQDDDQDSGREHAADGGEMTLHRAAIDRARRVELVALGDGQLHEPLDERRGVIGRCGGDRFDGAQNLRLERPIVLFEVERDLRIADAAHQRRDDPPREQRDDDERDRDAETDDGRRAESERFEAGGRDEQREQRAGEHDRRAAQRQFQAPAPADLLDEGDELGTVSRIGHSSSPDV